MATSNLRPLMKTMMCNILYDLEHPEVTPKSSDNGIEEMENPIDFYMEHREEIVEISDNGIEKVEETMALVDAGSTQLQTSSALTPRNCRICFSEEDASRTDLIISIGCRCTSDISYGHKSCLMEWFRVRLLNTLEVTCEVCKWPMGRIIQSTLLTLLERHLQNSSVEGEMPAELILLQVPIEYLDQLQVPIDTPNFNTLHPHIQDAINEKLYLQSKKHKAELKGRRQALLEMLRSRPDGPTQISLIRRGCEVLEDEYIEMVVVQQPNPPQRCAFFPRNGNPPNIKVSVYTDFEGVLQVPATSSHEDAVNALSRELVFNNFLLADLSRREHLTLLPRSMVVDAIYTDRAPTALNAPLSSVEGVEGVSLKREVTYGVYKIFPLIG